MLIKTGRFILKTFLGKRQFQPIFKMLHKIGLAGMNVGEGGMPEQSGESWVLKFVYSKLGQGGDTPFVFDVSANMGQFALNLLRTFGPGVRLWCFEPCQTSFAALQKGLSGRSNGTLVNAAMGSSEGEVEIFSPAPGSKLASLYQRTSVWDDQVGREVVLCTTLDGYCLQNAIRKIHFLKIDVEGHELEVLHGAKAMLQSNGIDFIQFEFSAAHIDARVFFHDFYLLLSGKYQIYRILQNGLAGIEQYKPELELFKRATNYLAVRDTEPVR